MPCISWTGAVRETGLFEKVLLLELFDYLISYQLGFSGLQRKNSILDFFGIMQHKPPAGLVRAAPLETTDRATSGLNQITVALAFTSGFARGAVRVRGRKED